MLFSNIFLSNTSAAHQNQIPLLILHGFLGMSDNWKTLATQYAENGFEVHTIDLRNHGRSFHSLEFNYEAMVQDIYNYCVEKNITKCYLLGHSMGGKLSMFFSVRYPHLVEKLLVADIAPKYYAPHHSEILAGLQAVNFTMKPSRAAVDNILTAHIPDFGTRQFLLKNLYWQTPAQLAFRFNLQAFLENIYKIGEALPANTMFTKPTQFIRADLSNYILDQDFILIKSHFPMAIIETIPNVGHWLHAENPKAFFDITVRFLNN